MQPSRFIVRDDVLGVHDEKWPAGLLQDGPGRQSEILPVRHGEYDTVRGPEAFCQVPSEGHLRSFGPAGQAGIVGRHVAACLEQTVCEDLRRRVARIRNAGEVGDAA